MREVLHANIDDVEFQLWDSASEEIVDQVEMEAYITNLEPKDAARVLVDSMTMFANDLKEALKKDLTDCYQRDAD
ncbi:MAG: hypothetical protein J3T61_11100 [Candidatus Brocadiales bacterium]|nr:hypothetical protein [Candidatus Bathyanammoxibius sp.]